MSGTSERETALKNAINRSVSFPNCIINSNETDVHKIAELKGSGFYKFFITETYGNFSCTTTIEILNKQLYIVGPSFLIKDAGNKKVAMNNSSLFISGFAGNISIVVDFFEAVDILPINADTAPESMSEFASIDGEILYYLKDVKTSKMTIGENISMNNLKTAGEIEVETIKFGQWLFTLSEDSSKVKTSCSINTHL